MNPHKLVSHQDHVYLEFIGLKLNYSEAVLSFYATSTWNKLPDELRICSNFDHF